MSIWTELLLDEDRIMVENVPHYNQTVIFNDEQIKQKSLSTFHLKNKRLLQHLQNSFEKLLSKQK